MENSKKYFWFLLNLVLLVVVLVGLSSVKAIWGYKSSLYPAKTITVSAEGKSITAPDIASFSFSVVAEGNDPEKIAEDNNKKINEAITLVKQKGIEEKDIKTTGYNLSPRYEYDEVRRMSFISGYRLTQTVELKIRDFSKISEILGELPKIGINQIGSLTFNVDEPEQYRSEAREEALEKAREKAKEMAKQAGVRLGDVVSFNESGGQPPIFYEKYGLGGVSTDAAYAPSPSIEPGSQEINVTVSVTYEIK
ncbi:SIMPL domain-containing protein [Candidatus Wolfebacteria bacterium]|nr:SIMPL domain-containing protein [Candidatus Wolfebacteria bacterium]